MPVDYIANRKFQKRILVISLLVIAWGLYDIFSGQASELIKFRSTNDSQISKSLLSIVFVLVAIVMAFFSAKNLIKKKRP